MCARGDGGDGGSTAAKQRNILPSLIVPNALSTLHFFSCLFFQRTPPMQGSKKRFLVYTDLMPPCCIFFSPGWVSLFLPGDAPPEPCAAHGAVLIPATEPHGVDQLQHPRCKTNPAPGDGESKSFPFPS